ncbi:S8 family peptidase [Paractinoplanes maris]|uniref:S8 family peptidase n=1 Tax=Paractinoplanes maris TaxID=1734446 RepID=UPI0020227F8E|nr:S8 family peptidase [Actinoplanes maris]
MAVDRTEWDGSWQMPAEFSPGAGPHAEAGRPAGEAVATAPDLVADSVISPPLRERMALGDGLIGVTIELRLRYDGGLAGATDRVREMLRWIRPAAAETAIVLNGYVTVALTAAEIRMLVSLDAESALESAGPSTEIVRAARDAIHRLWPNFGTTALITRSIVTTKCQAVHRSFNATGRGIVWAVLDSGIDGDHPHFRQHKNLVGMPHKSFVDADDALALRDEAGHGTHVAAILAGEQIAEGDKQLTASVAYWDDSGSGKLSSRETTFASICGMAPECKLLSCKVLRPDETGDLTGLIAALQYIAELNNGGKDLQVHGVNISVGHPFDPSWFAAGLTPVCREVDNLVRSGVVVVVAAGNSGYGYAQDRRLQPIRLGFDMTINDPGNAALALTVGSTSSSPHSTGVSYFSSKGPTGDGRLKPDLVAPGERIISAASGALLATAQGVSSAATYAENTGTSMAATHVSGAAAAFLSVHREFIGRPDAVREALLSTATDLGRARTFQGAGLVDAMRAIQSV